jgi:hypothetical protein
MTVPAFCMLGPSYICSHDSIYQVNFNLHYSRRLMSSLNIRDHGSPTLSLPTSSPSIAIYNLPFIACSYNLHIIEHHKSERNVAYVKLQLKIGGILEHTKSALLLFGIER